MIGSYHWRPTQEYGLGKAYVAELAGIRLVVVEYPNQILLLRRQSIADYVGAGVGPLRSPESKQWGGGVYPLKTMIFGAHESPEDFQEILPDCDTAEEAMIHAVGAYGRILTRLAGDAALSLVRSARPAGGITSLALDTLTKLRLQMEEIQQHVAESMGIPQEMLPPAPTKPEKVEPEKQEPPPVPTRLQVCSYCGLQLRHHPPVYSHRSDLVRVCNGNIANLNS